MISCTPLSFQAVKAVSDPLDSWSINVRLPSQSLVSPTPHCIATEREQAHQPGQDQPICAKGMFWNYLSVRSLLCCPSCRAFVLPDEESPAYLLGTAFARSSRCCRYREQWYGDAKSFAVTGYWGTEAGTLLQAQVVQIGLHVLPEGYPYRERAQQARSMIMPKCCIPLLHAECIAQHTVCFMTQHCIIRCFSL